MAKQILRSRMRANSENDWGGWHYAEALPRDAIVLLLNSGTFKPKSIILTFEDGSQDEYAIGESRD